MRSTVMFVILGLALVGCQMKKDDVSDSYELTSNNCPTGRHEFKGSSADDVKAQMCAALQDEKRNNGCAQNMRAKHFESKGCGAAKDFKPNYGAEKASDAQAEQMMLNVSGLTSEERAEGAKALSDLLSEQ